MTAEPTTAGARDSGARRRDRSPFAELLLRHRRSAGLSQGELADRCGLSERAIRDIESGSTARPRRSTMRAIGTGLGLTGDDLTRFLTGDRPAIELIPPTGSGLVAREAELRMLAALTMGGRHRLISLTGPSGVGKSRLVTEVIAALRPRYGLAVHRLDLSATVDASGLGELVAEVLGAGGASRLSPVERLAAHLRPARLLLVLDSFERVVAAAGWIRTLVGRCPGLTVIATSQVRLGVDGEHEIRLAPLAVPGAVTDLAVLAAVPAVRLLVQRAALARPGFVLTAGNARAVAGVCRRLDGLPLAIELAAARLRMLSPAELSDRLDRQLEILAGGPRGVPDRHRSLRAAIESSLEVVSGPARELFAGLGAFPGGVALDDLEAVIGGLGRGPGWLLDALAELVDASLVRVGADDDASRYRLPDAMAELAGEWLAGRPDADAVRRTVAVHYLDRLRTDPERAARFRLGHDADNVRAGLAWIIAQQPVRLDRPAIDAIFRYHDATGRFSAGQDVLTRAGDALVAHGAPGYAWIRAGRAAALRFDLVRAADLARMGLRSLPATDHAGRAMAYLLLGAVATYGGDLRTARDEIGRALTHGQACDDELLTGRILNNLGNLAMQLGDLTEARDRLTEALGARRRSGSGPVDTACTLNNLAEVALELGQHEQAIDHATEAVRLARAAGHERLVADTLSIIGLALVIQGRTDEAVTVTAPAAALMDGSAEHQNAVCVTLLRRSVVLHAAGNPAAASTLAAAVPMARGNIERVDLTLALEWHADLLADRAPATAARLLGAAAQIRRSITRPVAPADRHRIEGATATCRATLGPDRFDHELAAGAGLDETALTRLCGGIE